MTPNVQWVHLDSTACEGEVSEEIPGVGICIEHDRRVHRATLQPTAYSPSAYAEGTHRDDMLPADALSECYDLYASGAWPAENAEANLDEVMSHLGRLLGRE